MGMVETISQIIWDSYFTLFKKKKESADLHLQIRDGTVTRMRN